jgi:hypothetical protein
MVELSTSDVVVFNDGTVTPLTGATFHFLWCSGYVTKTGNAPYLDTVAFLYGNRSYESLIKQVQQLLWLEQLRFLIQMSRLAVGTGFS